ncbi:MAG: RNA polymerase Rpb4 family protein [Candidatus Heimdallarchaeota archaeon]
MPRKILKQKPLAISEVKAILEQRAEDGNFNYTQRVALDHAIKFSRLSADQATRLITKLQADFDLDLESAVQICNILPETLEELKSIISERYPNLDRTKLDAIFKYIEEVD